MANILVTNIPKGREPELVRLAWIGMPPLPVAEIIRGDLCIFPGGVRRNTIGYRVDGHKAIAILKKRWPQVAEWWLDNVPDVLKKGFCFKYMDCQFSP